MGIICKCLKECPEELKWIAMVVGFLDIILDRWLLSLSRRVLPVSPTYCWAHREQVMRYMRLDDKQLHFLRIENNLLCVELRKVEDIDMHVHVKHFLEWQGAEEAVG